MSTSTRRPATREKSAGARYAGSPVRRHAAVAAAVVLALLGLYLLYATSSSGATSAAGTTPAADFQVGEPGKGQVAPELSLTSTSGAGVSLADYRGRNVLLYFQEGIGCQPCWDQVRDLEKRMPDLKAAGVDDLVTVTTDPVDLLARKADDEGLRTPVLSDPDLVVSRRYGTTGYGMMGDSRNGHSFVLVGPDGTIRWRADYGGAPKYTMFVPVDRLLADLRAGVA